MICAQGLPVEGQFKLLFVLVYLIDSLESSGHIATSISESKAGILPLTQHYIAQNK